MNAVFVGGPAGRVDVGVIHGSLALELVRADLLSESRGRKPVRVIVAVLGATLLLWHVYTWMRWGMKLRRWDPVRVHTTEPRVVVPLVGIVMSGKVTTDKQSGRHIQWWCASSEARVAREGETRHVDVRIRVWRAAAELGFSAAQPSYFALLEGQTNSDLDEFYMDELVFRSSTGI